MRRPEGPDRTEALEQYRRRAGVYDWELALFEPLRTEAVALLGLRTGNVVLDVGCGTGLSLPLLHDGVGATGRVVGIEQSPEMIALARRRVAQERWPKVTLVCSPVETADISVEADAALFHFTHDILRRPDAVINVLRHLKPGARIVAAGLKWAAPWPMGAVNLFVMTAAWRSVTSFEGLDAPWGLLQDRIGAMQVWSRLLGAAYVATGTYASAGH